MLDEHGTVKIVDMGIAGRLEGRASLAQKDGVFGSPHYMAPEQAAGERIDHRVDIYGLGASAYRMLSGRTVFTGESQTEIMSKHVNEQPDRLKRVAPWVPKSLCDIVMKMLRKKPEERYQSASQVVETLGKLSSDGTAAKRPTELKRMPIRDERPKLSRHQRQRRNQLILLALIGALVVIVVLVLLIPTR
jgi:serine/threonine protein kinase